MEEGKVRIGLKQYIFGCKGAPKEVRGSGSSRKKSLKMPATTWGFSVGLISIFSFSVDNKYLISVARRGEAQRNRTSCFARHGQDCAAMEKQRDARFSKSARSASSLSWLGDTRNTPSALNPVSIGHLDVRSMGERTVLTQPSAQQLRDPVDRGGVWVKRMAAAND